MPGDGGYKQTALAFTKALASRDYRAAYDLTAGAREGGELRVRTAEFGRP